MGRTELRDRRHRPRSDRLPLHRRIGGARELIGLRWLFLGTAAGGGVPQWNCGCDRCVAARRGAEPGRLGDSLAVSAGDGEWLLLNAAPDLARQLAATPALWPPPGTRRAPLSRVALTDAQLDHVLGLYELRQADRLEVAGTSTVLRAVRDELGLGRALEAYVDVTWRELEPGVAADVGPLAVRPIATGAPPPRYARRVGERGGGPDAAGWSVAFEIASSSRSIVYAPAVARATPELLAACERAAFVAFDGTFWSDGEPVLAGIGTRSASAMGHLPIEPGSLALLAGLPGRRAYTHLNNTNPLLDPDSQERRAVAGCGVDVALDGGAGAA